MISNDKQLKIVREQLALAESALAHLRQRVKNERNFAVYSEGPVDQIAELKAEIEAYERMGKKKNGKANGRGGKRRPRKAS